MKVVVKNLDQFLYHVFSLKKCNLIKLMIFNFKKTTLDLDFKVFTLKFLEKFFLLPTMIIENHPLEPSELNKFLFSQNYDFGSKTFKHYSG